MPGGVDVPERGVAGVPQRVMGQAVLPEVVADVAVRPVGQGVQLPASVAQLQEIDARARAGLAAAQPGDPGAHPEFLERALHGLDLAQAVVRSEEHTSELQSLMRISYAVFCLKKKK